MIFGRSHDTQEPHAIYARVLDGRHLWLAVRGADSLSLGGAPVATDHDGDLLVGIVALEAGFPADIDEVPLTAGRRQVPVRSASAAPPSPAGSGPAAGFEVVDVDGAVAVRRRPVPDHVEVLAFESDDAGVRIRLDLRPDAHHAQGRVEVRHQGTTLAELPMHDGVVTITELPELPLGATAVLTFDGLPVLRRANGLATPNFAVLLPPLPFEGLELRWQPPGRLAVRRT